MEVLTRETSEDILRRNEIGRLACFSVLAGEAYVVPISYRYQDGCIYFACMPGQKLRYIREHPDGVCLEVDEVNDSQQWLTVVVHGTVSQASGWEQVEQGFPTMRRVTRGPLRSQFAADASPESMAELVMCVLRPTRISGRKDRWTVRAQETPMVTPHRLIGQLTG